MKNLQSAEIDFNKETCIIVDANSWVHKCWHACKPVYDNNGKDQRILHGMLNMLSSLTNHLKRTDFLITVFDPPDGDLFRKSQFSGYKANRPPTDEDLIRQKRDSIHAFKNIYGLPDVTYSGYEADDIIGSLAKLLSKDMQVIIISPDKDMAQLVSKNVFLMRQYKGAEGNAYQYMDELVVKDFFGVFPQQIPDYLALMGDTADNLPGLEKVGSKTSAKIISKYISISNILRDIEQVEEKSLKEKIMSTQESIQLVRDLATIVTDLPLQSYLDNSLQHSSMIREHAKYHDNLIRAENYFKIKPYIKNLFL